MRNCIPEECEYYLACAIVGLFDDNKLPCEREEAECPEEEEAQ